MNDICKSKQVELQDNGIIRDMKGTILGRLVEECKNSENECKKLRELLLEINQDLKTMEHSSVGKGSKFHERIKEALGE